MPESADRRGKPPRTWRPMVLWTAGILLGLGLAWLIAVAAQFWQTRRTIIDIANTLRNWDTVAKAELTNIDVRLLLVEGGVQRLGGPKAAARRLDRYLDMSDRLAPHKHIAAALLGKCGNSGVFPAAKALANPNPLCRYWAAYCFLLNSDHESDWDARPAIPALVRALDDPDETMWSLGVGPRQSTRRIELGYHPEPLFAP
jgi:hypothetical protein